MEKRESKPDKSINLNNNKRHTNNNLPTQQQTTYNLELNKRRMCLWQET